LGGKRRLNTCYSPSGNAFLCKSLTQSPTASKPGQTASNDSIKELSTPLFQGYLKPEASNTDLSPTFFTDNPRHN
jgi:hypothetical protein